MPDRTALLIGGPLDGQTRPIEAVTKWLRLPDEEPGGFYMLARVPTDNTETEYLYRWEEER